MYALSDSREVGKYKLVVPFDAVVQVVCDHYACKTAAILTSKRGRQERNIARWMAMKLSQEHTEMTLLQLADRFHVRSYSAISTTVGNLNELLVSEPMLQKTYQRLSILIDELKT